VRIEKEELESKGKMEEGNKKRRKRKVR